VADKSNRGRSDEARDPNRPTFTDPETGEIEKEGLGPRDGQLNEDVDTANDAPVDVDTETSES
jgi:hypothetical protein